MFFDLDPLCWLLAKFLGTTFCAAAAAVAAGGQAQAVRQARINGERPPTVDALMAEFSLEVAGRRKLAHGELARTTAWA